MLKLGLKKQTVFVTLIAFVGALALALGGYLLFAQNKNDNSDQTTEFACSTEGEGAPLTEASRSMYSTGEDADAELGATVEEIKLIDGYERDINCVYPALMYSLRVGGIDESTKNFELFKSLKNEGHEVSEVYGDVLSIEEIEEYMDFISSYDERVEHNTIPLGP